MHTVPSTITRLVPMKLPASENVSSKSSERAAEPSVADKPEFLRPMITCSPSSSVSRVAPGPPTSMMSGSTMGITSTVAPPPLMCLSSSPRSDDASTLSPCAMARCETPTCLAFTRTTGRPSFLIDPSGVAIRDSSSPLFDVDASAC